MIRKNEHFVLSILITLKGKKKKYRQPATLCYKFFLSLMHDILIVV